MIVAGLCGFLVYSAAAQPTFTTFQISGGDTWPTAINNAGIITGYAGENYTGFLGFTYAAGGAVSQFSAASSPYLVETFASSINKAGTVVGYFSEYTAPPTEGGIDLSHCFMRDSSATITTFDAPGAGTTEDSQGTLCTCIITGGAVAGYYVATNTAQGFLLSPSGRFTSFAPSGAVYTYPTSINAGGSIAGYYADADNVDHGFVRTAGGIVTFEMPGAIRTQAFAINSKGTITGTYTDTNNITHGFVRSSDGTITTFDAPGAGTGKSYGTIATGISEGGEIAGYFSDPEGRSHGFVRSAGGRITPFEAPGAASGPNVGTWALAISPSGAIAGYYSDTGGAVHGFLRTP